LPGVPGEIAVWQQLRRPFDPFSGTVLRPCLLDLSSEQRPSFYAASDWDKKQGDTGHRLRRSRRAPPAYPKRLLMRDLAIVKEAWRKYQSYADRDGVYTYLTSVYALAATWSRKNRANSRARRALRSARDPIKMALEPTAITIFCTADPAKVDEFDPSGPGCFVTRRTTTRHQDRSPRLLNPVRESTDVPACCRRRRTRIERLIRR